METLQLSRLGSTPNSAKVTAWLDDVVGTIGWGFHPDTPAGEYVRDDGTKLLSEETSRGLDADLDAAWSVLDHCGLDPYAVALESACRKLGGLPIYG